MRKVLVLGMMLAAVAGTVMADGMAAKKEAKAPTKKSMQMKGTVVSVDAVANKVVIKDAKGVSSDLTVSADTRIMRNGKKATLAEIMADDSVQATCSDVNGVMTCKSIKARAPKKAAAAAKK